MAKARKPALRIVKGFDLNRPMPPTDLRITGEFRPAPDVAKWLVGAFIAPDATMRNDDHAHLRGANIGVLWTNVHNSRQMRTVLATAEIPAFRCGAWQKARHEQQLEEWFGDIPDFLLTFQAGWAETVSNIEWCAVAEHELFHCSQAHDAFGMPKFRADGSPSYALKGHDVEEFIGVVRRYGAVSPEVRAMVDAVLVGERVAEIDIARSCGTCLSAAA